MLSPKKQALSLEMVIFNTFLCICKRKDIVGSHAFLFACLFCGTEFGGLVFQDSRTLIFSHLKVFPLLPPSQFLSLLASWCAPPFILPQKLPYSNFKRNFI